MTFRSKTLLALPAALALALALATAATANPISCEQPGDIAVGDDGATVVVTFFDMCSSPDEIGDYWAVQWRDGGDWVTIEGSWSADGTADLEGGSGVETYPRYRSEVGCPVKGAVDVRLAYVDDGEAWDLFTGAVDCSEVGGGDDDDDSPPPACNMANRPAAAGALGLLGLITLALVHRRW